MLLARQLAVAGYGRLLASRQFLSFQREVHQLARVPTDKQQHTTRIRHVAYSTISPTPPLKKH